MWYLYNRKGTRVCLDQGTQENIMETIEEYLKQDENMEFSIVHYDEITTAPEMIVIRGKDDYIEYMKQYYHEVMANKSIMELKKEMFDIIDKPKTKKFTKN